MCLTCLCGLTVSEFHSGLERKLTGLTQTAVEVTLERLHQTPSVYRICLYFLVSPVSYRPVEVPHQVRTRAVPLPVEVWDVWTLRGRPGVEVKDAMVW